MARPSRTGSKKSEAKARNASPAKGRKTTKTKPRIAPAPTRAKRRPASDPSKDLKEAREQQAATADILKVIASSPSDVQPVFEAIVANADRLIGGYSTGVYRFVGGVVHLAAFTPVNPVADELLTSRFPRPVAGIWHFERAHAGEIAEVADTETDAADLPLREIARARGFRSVLYSPLMSKGTAIGVIVVSRKKPGSFSAHHVQLLRTFADQAVIAIENVRLFNETQEALERQTATADILKVIASSPSDVQPVLQTLAISALRLCEALSATVLLRDGEVVIPLAHVGPLLAPLGERQPLHRRWVTGRAVLEGITIHVPDMLEMSESEYPDGKNMALKYGHRATLATPLIREGQAIGAILVRRRDPRPFSGKQIALLETFADQAVIAIENARLFEEVQARTNDLTESLQQQTATADVLKVISRSAFDLQTVLETLVVSAARLCEADEGTIFQPRDDAYRLTASCGLSPARKVFLESCSFQPGTGSAIGRVLLEGKTVHIEDSQTDPNYRFQDPGPVRTRLGVPLLREGAPIGVFVLARRDVRPFSDKQIELVQTFADQAVIAIENSRLFDEVQTKTRDLTEALTYQTGSSNILSVIASSPTDVAPVLRAIVESASELCDADDAIVFLQNGGDLHSAAHSGPIAEGPARVPITRSLMTGRSFLDRKAVHLHDVLSAEGAEFPEGQKMARIVGYRTMLTVPLLRESEAIGVIVLRRKKVHPFRDEQITLLQTFADQAVIAIGNVRLFEEVQAKTRDLSEALEHQTAISDILKVISGSPGDVRPVFMAVARHAAQICEAKVVDILTVEDDRLLFAANVGEFARADGAPLNRDSVMGCSIIDKEPIHVIDLQSKDHDFPLGRDFAFALGHRTTLAVPLIREGRALGTILVRRAEVRPFADRHIALLKTFADQAAIAIENARLLNEVQAKTRDLTESLQQQTATADVLQVISASPGELEPVFETMLANAMRLCEASNGVIWLREGDGFRSAALRGPWEGDFIERWRRGTVARPGSDTPMARALATGAAAQVEDLTKTEAYRSGDPLPVAAADVGGIRTALAVPMLREGECIGVFALSRREVRLFTEKQLEFVANFAKQAVIAIQNAHLLNELRKRTTELSQSLDDLRAAQGRLVQTEKLASLGQLTAGIAHEIKNPLNFVNNFSALTAELTDELNDLLKPAPLDDKMRGEADELTGMIKDNLQKVVQHGKRADSIVKNMLLHSREGSREHRPADINSLLDESLNLAYHGVRAEKGEFNITLQRDFDADAGTIELFPQEITRAFLNLIANGVYAATRRKTEDKEPDFEPTLRATTKNLGNAVEIRIRDNGTGIPAEVREKIFNPFFTTKPAGEGTGLGLSMTHDIIVKQHGGRIDVATEPGQFAEFIIVLPRMAATGKAGADK